ncbi:MAG: ATP-binding protein [Verrucomicrobiota bacterium]|nr:ATP-binding protein [Verrucomicrobiota bacterium]
MLRWRLSLGFVLLLGIFLTAGGYSIFLFQSLSSSVNSVLTKNYESIRAVHRLRVSTATLNAGFLGDNEMSGSQKVDLFRVRSEVMKRSLDTLRINASSPAEAQAVEMISKDVDSYNKVISALIALSESETVKRRGEFARRVSVYVLAITTNGENLVLINEQTLKKSAAEARAKPKEYAWAMVNMLVICSIISAFAFYWMGKSILAPIRELTTSAQMIGDGNLDHQVVSESQDELGNLARTFNGMAEKLRAYRDAAASKMSRLNQTFETTLASFPDPIYFLYDNGQVTMANPAAVNLNGKFDLHNKLPIDFAEHAERALASGTNYLPDSLKDAICLRVDNQEKFYLPRIVGLTDNTKTNFAVAVILEDVTGFRLVDDMKTNMLGTVSHELKTPLTSIRLVLYILLEESIGQLSDQQKSLVEAARNDSDRLLAMLNDLLDLTRLESSLPSMIMESASARELLDECVSNAASLIHDNKKVYLDPSINADLPLLMMDRLRIRHAIGNLISNAVKFSPENGKVKVTANYVSENSFRISVVDEGPGIPKEYQHKVFEKFYRAPGQKIQGAGLGLSIAREIVEAHGGRMGLISELGKGSEFYIDLPVPKRKVEKNEKEYSYS